MFKKLVGMWKTKSKNGKTYFSIIRKTENPYIFEKSTRDKKENIKIIDDVLEIKYGHKKYYGTMFKNKIIWKNKYNYQISQWDRVKWINGAELLKGNFIGMESLFGVKDLFGNIVGIRSNNEKHIFILSTKTGKINNVSKLNIAEISLLQSVIEYGRRGHSCKYM